MFKQVNQLITYAGVRSTAREVRLVRSFDAKRLSAQYPSHPSPRMTFDIWRTIGRTLLHT